MNPRHVIPVAVTLLLLGALSLVLFLPGKVPAPSQDSKRRFNVVMIVSDALRADVLGCYGGEAATPAIDRLARRGVRFENAFATSPWTAPSSVSLFTGNYASSYPSEEFNHTMRVSVPDGEMLLAEALEQCGYHLPMRIENVQASLHNNLQGFSTIPNIGDIDRAVPKAIKNRITALTQRKRFKTAAYRNSFIVLKHLLELPPGKPFFLLHWMLDPHEPYDPIDKFAKRISVDRRALSRHERFYSSRRNFKLALNQTEEEYIRRRYLAEVESLDERVGYLVSVLEHLDLIDTTIIIFTADHGEQFGEHGQYGHGGFGVTSNFYDVLLRVPLIVAGPELPAGHRVDTPVSLLGLMATLGEHLGVRYPSKMQGRSFLPFIHGDADEPTPLYFDDIRVHEQVDAILHWPYKLITSMKQNPQLFDIAADRNELDNLYQERPALAATLFEQLRPFRERNLDRKIILTKTLTDTTTHLSEQERREMLEQLKSLGYIE